MARVRAALAAGFLLLLWAGCSDDQATAPEIVTPDSPELVLSNPVAAGVAPALGSTRGMAALAYISLPPGSIPGAEFVVIRNLQFGGSVTTRIVSGGFDPVAVSASPGDRLELEFYGGGSVVARKYGTVPVRRPPTVVRTSPPAGRTDVALGVRPTVVFSEPVDPASVDGAVRLLLGGQPVPSAAEPHPSAPWAVEIIPASPLEPETTYELEAGTGVRDMDGDALEAVFGAGFTTEPAEPPPPPSVPPEDPPPPIEPPATPPPPAPAPSGPGRIAFTSSRTGVQVIYLANADGSGVEELVAGSAPTWSWDGRRIAFNREGLYVINADGSGEQELPVQGGTASWSTDDTKLVFAASDGIAVVDLASGQRTLLVSPAQIQGSPLLAQPAWSPNGRQIAFAAYPESDYGQLWVVDFDGSNLRQLGYGAVPAWSPDGLRVAFSTVEGSTECASPVSVVASIEPSGAGAPTVHFRAPCDDPEWQRYAWGVEWSPDGMQLVFTMDSKPSGTMIPARIHAVDLATGITRQLIPDAPGVPPDYQDTWVTWSRVSP